jgi:hypothetical protein
VSDSTEEPGPLRRIGEGLDGLRAQARGFRRLFALTRPYRGLLATAWLATIGYAAAGALLALVVEPIFD